MAALKASNPSNIVTSMRHLFVIAAVSLLAALPAAAQSTAVGISLGIAQPAEDGFDVGFDQSVKELYFATEIEPDAFFKVKLGRLETENAPEGVVDPDGTIDYAAAVIEYRFDEIYGSTGLFLGGGYYKQEFGEFDEAEWGLHAGVNGIFPITRRLGFIGEIGYHWIQFEDKQSYYTATGGLNMRF